MIECAITINGERTIFSTSLKINPNVWNAAKQRVKGKTQETQIINASLQAIHNKLYEKALKLTPKGLFITANLLRHAHFNWKILMTWYVLTSLMKKVIYIFILSVVNVIVGINIPNRILHLKYVWMN